MLVAVTWSECEVVTHRRAVGCLQGGVWHHHVVVLRGGPDPPVHLRRQGVPVMPALGGLLPMWKEGTPPWNRQSGDPSQRWCEPPCPVGGWASWLL